MQEFVITANSPGEIASWVKPVVKKLKEYYPQSLITVFLTPCVFASGSEKEVLSAYPEIDRVFNKYQYLKFILPGCRQPQINKSKKGLVIFLGGDLFHAVLLGRKFDYPVIAYTEGVFSWSNSIEKFMVPDERTKKKLFAKGAKADKVEVIGNLMFDAVTPMMTPAATREYLQLEHEFVINLLPGSRPAAVEYMLPFFLQSILNLKESELDWNPEDYRFIINRSPFISRELLQDIFEEYLAENNLEGNIKYRNHCMILSVGDNFKLEVHDKYRYSLMQITTLALTIPGTNNLELAHLGIPMIVILPLNRPEDIPLEGPAGLIGQIPVLGPAVKKIIIPRIEKKRDFIALPNITAEKEIVPEVRGVLTPDDLAVKIREIINDKSRLSVIKDDLKANTGKSGAADRLLKIADYSLASGP